MVLNDTKSICRETERERLRKTQIKYDSRKGMQNNKRQDMIHGM